MKNMSESANSAKSAKQIFANFAKFVKPICGTTRRSEGSVTEAEYPTNYQRISNLSLTIRPFRVAILAVLLVFVGGWNMQAWGNTATLSAKNSSVQKDGITFSLGGSYTINNNLVDYTYTGDGKEASLSWTVPQGYSINVSQITINAKNAKS